MQYICSPIIISLTPTTTHNTKKFVIEFSLGLTNGPLSLMVVLCGDLCCTLFNIQQTQSTQGPSEDAFSQGCVLKLIKIEQQRII